LKVVQHNLPGHTTPFQL